MKVRLTSVTDVGIARCNNEDSVALCPCLESPDWTVSDTVDWIPINHTLAIVADGLGGQNAGEVAASIAIETFHSLEPPTVSSDDNYHQQLSRVIAQCDDNIFAHAQQHPETHGMGTTVTACWMHDGRAHVAWCGDSRCYVFSPSHGLRQVTKDHSYVQELIDRGELTRRDAFEHPDSHIITRGCGDLDCIATPEFVDFDLHPRDMLMMCSDGLFGCCYDTDIELILYRYYSDPSSCRNALLQAALDAGAPDNISVIVASILDDDAVCSSGVPNKPQLTLPERFRFLIKRIKYRLQGIIQS